MHLYDGAFGQDCYFGPAEKDQQGSPQVKIASPDVSARLLEMVPTVSGVGRRERSPTGRG